MSSVANDNLALARATRSSGYRTKLHELPELKDWFDREYQQGVKTIQQLRREAIELFPHYSGQIPSNRRLQSYVITYLNKPVVIAPFTPQYHDRMRNFDSYLAMHELAKELWERYETAKRAEMNVVFSRRLMSARWVKEYADTIKMMFDAEVRMGLRDNLAGPYLNHQYEIMGYGNQSEKSDRENADDELGPLAYIDLVNNIRAIKGV
jgi:hypothetical protein